ncbi:hypothetical protein [uncultured Polaribacter sp.]|uniref:hypothetical protein n=1 Tax=uncultured Polaribacter sp. TaxID=174711 RepID=UPI002618C0E8|nr:hypothetical protein [uncultured Polaribacter sp.]
MSKTNQLILLLDSLDKKEFDKIVKIYLQKEYGFKKVVFTDGKDDVGLDIRVFDFEGQNIQYQLTVQKSKSQSEMYSFTKKVIEDVEKAKINVSEFDSKDKLIFFYSKKLTNKRIRNLQGIAFKEHSINLEIIDANRIAEEAENIIEIQSELYKINELDKFKVDNSSFDNNLLYDLLSFGKPTEFKTQIIDSFVLQLFFIKENLEKKEVKEACENQFQVKENDVFYNKLINRFLSEKRIIKNKTLGNYSLTSDEKNRLDSRNKEFELEKKLFIKNVIEILTKYNQEQDVDNYIIQLKQLYIDNFNSDLSDALKNDEEFHIFSMCRDFVKFIEIKIKNKSKAKELSKELLKFCVNNKFIQKIAASKVYSSRIDNSRLENYLNNKKKIFIDTAIGLNSLCYFFNPKIDYQNYFYRATKNLIEFAKNENIKLYISQRYVWEMQSQINDAFNLVPFTLIPQFEHLGSSRNIFYNFFNFLKKTDNIDDNINFKDFLEKFGFRERSGSKSFQSIILNSLSQIQIEEQVIEKVYNIEEANKIFSDSLLKLHKQKSSFTQSNDSIMLEFLADDDVEVHPLQPVFLTWDRAFFESHVAYNKKFPKSQDWLMLSPNKLVDVYSILKFSINSETVTENLLALISDDIIQNTYSLVDTLSIVLNPNDDVGLEYSTKLAKIRESEINKLNSEDVTRPENFEGEAVIDDIFFKLTTYYKDSESKLNDFKNLFTQKIYMEKVIEVLIKTVADFYKNKFLNDNVISEFDKLIEIANKER